MKKAVFAILYHFTDIGNSAEFHQFCPRDKGSWCKYWCVSKTYTPSNSIPLWIKTLVLPIMKSLQDDELLKKCLHGKTQNANEALNGIIWSRVPKTTFVDKDTIKMGAFSAVLHYNDGRQGILKVLKQFDLSGENSVEMSRSIDTTRVKQMKRKSSATGKKQRKRLRTIKRIQ
jgi:hypothetical protein